MPSIKIREVDATSAGTVLTAQDVVFVPGFVNAQYATSGAEGIVAEYIPTLCETVTQFESYFGKIPAVFEKAQNYPNGFADNATGKTSTKTTVQMLEANTMDLGYVFAKELLNLGVPVCYVRCNPKDEFDSKGVNTTNYISVDHMYKVLAGLVDFQMWDEIEDIGEYAEIKYLTSGGYPTFEYYNIGKIIPETEDINLGPEEFVQETFTNKVKREPDIDTLNVFTYAKALIGCKTFNTEAEREAYKKSAIDGEYCIQLDTGDAYKMTIEGSSRAWENANNKKSWVFEQTYYDITQGKDVTVTVEDIPSTGEGSMKDYGFNFDDLTIDNLQIGAVISIKLSVTGSSTIANKMLVCAATRGDCVALIDHTCRQDRPLDPTSKKSVYYSISNDNSMYKISSNGEFGTMFTPWCACNFASALNNAQNAEVRTPVAMPASFSYLIALAKSIQTNVNWLAIAGAARGVVNISKQMLTGNLRLSNAIADEYQPRNGIAINAITNIKPYGYIIWGNRTLKNNATEGNLTATSFLNTRNMVSDIKKLAYTAAKRCMFEQNSDILWINYKARITPLLDQMVTGNGLSGYKLIKGTTDEKAKLVCTIRLYPIYAVESFDITVELADDEVTVS